MLENSDLNKLMIQEKLVSNNYYLNKSAKDAYRSYILAYNSHSMKDIFNVHQLDLQVLLYSSQWNILSCIAFPIKRSVFARIGVECIIF